MKNILKSRRKELDLTMLQVAQYVGVSEATISRWESGNIANMRRDRIGKLSEILQLNPSVIMGTGDEVLPVNIIPIPSTKAIPLVGTIACGTPILAQENIEDYIKIDKNIPADFALRCKGDSMINSRIYDGDIVYIRKQSDVDDGEVAAVLVDNEATLKKVYKYPNKIVLRASNPVYDDMIYTNEELENVSIIGKAVAFFSVIR